MLPSPDILLINPYIWDFTAYDLWAKPLGLLYLAGSLRANGYQVHLLDCLDIHFQGTGSVGPLPPRKAFGTGKYFRQRLAKPPALQDIPKYYYRYGKTTCLPPTVRPCGHKYFLSPVPSGHSSPQSSQRRRPYFMKNR